MKIAVLNETSSADRNVDILRALEGRGCEVMNCGMKKNGEPPELTYIHTGFLAALLLASGKADFVVGGCGTGQGFMNSALQYPGVVCGHLQTPLDAFLFARINDGNCVSLTLNQGYGWAGDVNLRLIFDQLFTEERGAGFPAHRKESQRQSRELLSRVSSQARRSMVEIIDSLPDEIVLPALGFPGIFETLADYPERGSDLLSSVKRRLGR